MANLEKQKEQEPFIPYMDEEDFSPELIPVLEPYKKRMGFLPNALKLYAYRPEIAKPLWELNSKIMRDSSSTLDQYLKRRLAALASKSNGCAYCTAHSASMLKADKKGMSEGWGMEDEELKEMLSYEYAPADPFEKACFDFVREASLDPTSVPDELLEQLKTHLSEPQIIELASLVGFWKFYNTVHDSLHIPVEAELMADTVYAD